MYTWSASTCHGEHGGTSSSPAEAWNAAHEAAAVLINDGALEAVTLAVDGTSSTIHPADSGDRAHDIAATLGVLEDGRLALLGAYEEAG